LSLFGWSLPAGCTTLPDEVYEPEDCPTCGKPNRDDNDEWICGEAEGFCSVDCRNDYMRMEAEQDAAEARALEEADELAQRA
jgi:hypothetical protein